MKFQNVDIGLHIYFLTNLNIGNWASLRARRNRHSSVDFVTFWTNLGREWCRNIRQIGTYSRQNHLFTHLFYSDLKIEHFFLWLIFTLIFHLLLALTLLLYDHSNTRYSVFLTKLINICFTRVSKLDDYQWHPRSKVGKLGSRS